MKVVMLLTGILMVAVSCTSYEPAMPNDLFKSGDMGYHSFRIPSLITTQDGTLLAFAEGRVNGLGDAGDINLVMRRSGDGGHTWSDAKSIWDDEDNICGNPTPVVLENGDIVLVVTWGHGKEHEGSIIRSKAKYGKVPHVMKSTDDGLSWSKPIDISAMADKKEWMWYATGPGNGIQLKYGKYKGRIVVPCSNSTVDKGYNSHVIYSDDNGETWKYSSEVGPGSNESAVVQLTDGTLIFNTRQQSNRSGFRGQAISRDGGATWSEYTNKTALKGPVCQASLITYENNILLFSNPQGRGRSDGVVQMSCDGTKTWQKIFELPKGSFAYSSLTVLPSGDVGILYETSGYKKIHFRVIPKSAITQSQ